MTKQSNGNRRPPTPPVAAATVTNIPIHMPRFFEIRFSESGLLSLNRFGNFAVLVFEIWFAEWLEPYR